MVNKVLFRKSYYLVLCLLFENIFLIGKALKRIDTNNNLSGLQDVSQKYIPLNAYWILSLGENELEYSIEYLSQKLYIDKKYKNLTIVDNIQPLNFSIQLIKLKTPFYGNYYPFNSIFSNHMKFLSHKVENWINYMILADAIDILPEDLAPPLVSRRGSTKPVPPPLPPRDSTKPVPPPLPPRDLAKPIPPPLPPRDSAKPVPPPLPPRDSAKPVPPPLPPRDSTKPVPPKGPIPSAPPRGSTIPAGSSRAPQDVKVAPNPNPVSSPHQDTLLKDIQLSKYLIQYKVNKSLDQVLEFSHFGWLIESLNKEEKNIISKNEHTLLVPKKASYWLLKEEVKKRVDLQKRDIINAHLFNQIIIPQAKKIIEFVNLNNEVFKVKNSGEFFEIDNLQDESEQILGKGKKIQQLAVYPIEKWLKGDKVNSILGLSPYRELSSEKAVFNQLEESSFNLMKTLIKNVEYEVLLKVKNGCIVLVMEDRKWIELAKFLNCKSDFSDYPIQKLQKLLENFIIFTENPETKKENISGEFISLSGVKYKFDKSNLYRIDNGETLLTYLDTKNNRMQESSNGLLIQLEKNVLSEDELKEFCLKLPESKSSSPSIDSGKKTNSSLTDALKDAIDARRPRYEYDSEDEEGNEDEWD